MAINPRIPGKPQSNETTSAPAKTPQAPVAPKPGFVEKTSAPPVAAVMASAASEPAPVAAPPRAKAALASSVSPRIDANAWSLKSLELFNENAVAIFDYAAALGNVKSFTDALELQSRFARERYSTFVRQANEVAELTRRFTLDSSVSLRRTFTGSAA